MRPREMLLMEGFCKLLSSQPYQTVPPQKQTLIMQKMAVKVSDINELSKYLIGRQLGRLVVS